MQSRFYNFFAICCLDQYHLFVKGLLYTWPDSNIYSYSRNRIVYPSLNELIVPISKIVRKIMLFPDPDNVASPSCFVIMDYCRPHLPCTVEDIVVPVYPEIDDMVKMCGSNDESWFGLVKSVNLGNKTCDINFYVEDPSCAGRYKQLNPLMFTPNTMIGILPQIFPFVCLSFPIWEKQLQVQPINVYSKYHDGNILPICVSEFSNIGKAVTS